MFFLFPFPVLHLNASPPAACSAVPPSVCLPVYPSVRLRAPDCLGFSCVPGDLLCTRYSHFLCLLSLLPPVHLTIPLSISPCLYPAPPPPVLYHLYIFLSICEAPSHSLRRYLVFFPPPSLPPSSHVGFSYVV